MTALCIAPECENQGCTECNCAAPIHELKTWPLYFASVEDGSKPFEARKNDRNFRVGDVLALNEWEPDRQRYTGRVLLRRVTYILPGGAFGVEPGYVVMGLGPVPSGKSPNDQGKRTGKSASF